MTNKDATTKAVRDPKTGRFVRTKTDSEKAVSDAEKKALVEATGGDPDVAAFFLSWLKNGKNATRAYLELHPGVKPESAQTCGCRMLSRVKVSAILESYNLGIDAYMRQLMEGIEAKKEIVIGSGEDSSLEYVPDHRTRRHYHKALGEMLKLEGVAPVVQVNNQNNLQQNNIENLSEEELDLLVNR